MAAKDFVLGNEGMRFSIVTDRVRGSIVRGRNITVRVVGFIGDDYVVAEISEGDASKFKEGEIWTRSKLESTSFRSVVDPTTDMNVIIESSQIDYMVQLPSSMLLTDVEDEAEAE